MIFQMMIQKHTYFVNIGCWIVCTFVDKVFVMTLLIFHKAKEKNLIIAIKYKIPFFWLQ